VTDQQAPAEVPHDDNENDLILEAFRRKSSYGVAQFLFEFWPAWMFSPKRKAIAPLCRVIIGDDDDGSILIDKSVLITGLLHLAEALTRAVAFNFQRASELPGISVDVPGGESHVLGIIGSVEEQLKIIRKTVENKNFILPDDDEQHEI
jgi:hypothetical protein